MLSNILNISLNHLIQFPRDGHVSTHKIHLRFLKLFQNTINTLTNSISRKTLKKNLFEITFRIYLIKYLSIIK